MSKSEHAVSHQFEPYHGNLRSYVLGFFSSIVFTLAAYVLVVYHGASHAGIMVGITVLALSQLMAQLVFFLHLGKESKPRWNLTVFLFAVMVVVILVAGSLWIMYHLNYNMETPGAENTYLQQQDGL